MMPWLIVWRAHFVGIKLFNILLASSSNPNYIHEGRISFHFPANVLSLSFPAPSTRNPPRQEIRKNVPSQEK